MAQVLEALMGLAQRTGAVRVRTGPTDEALRSARICYDHLAGERGVAMLDSFRRRDLIAGDEDLRVDADGPRFFVDFGIDMAALERGRRPLCRACLDWSERRSHLGGALGAAILAQVLDRDWARRDRPDARFSPTKVLSNSSNRSRRRRVNSRVRFPSRNGDFRIAALPGPLEDNP